MPTSGSPVPLCPSASELASAQEPPGSIKGLRECAPLTREELRELYRKLILIRRSEEKIRQEYSQDEMKTPVHLGVGEEAIPVGVLFCCAPGHPKAFGTYRNHALYLAMTDDLESFFGELYGKMTGPAKGKAGSMHLASPERGLLATSAVVGTTIPLAVGAALANRYRKSEEVVVSFFGDGAIEEGVFWESLNFACLKRLRVLFVCEDNGLAIHAPTRDRQGFRSILQAIQGFDCYAAGGDGADLMQVISLTQMVLKKMQEDPRPAFLHLTYHRFLEHVGSKEDWDAGYRRKPTQEVLNQLDPVVRFEKAVAQNGITPKELEIIRHEVEERIIQALLRAKSAPLPPLSELYTDVTG